MIAATQIKKGAAIALNGELYRLFIPAWAPGNWRGMVQTKLKSIKFGSTLNTGSGRKIAEQAHWRRTK